jgi:hypothetical protein
VQGETDEAMAETDALKLQARLGDLTVCEWELVKESRKGSKDEGYYNL